MDNVPSKPILQTDADPTVTRIFPALAAEIGLNESIVLLQIAHWIKSTNNLRDGQWWTYQSVRDMKKKAFSYWSAPTISRIINKLISAGYIFANDEYNEKRYDKTRWYALNPAKLQSLKGIALRYEDMNPAKAAPAKAVSKDNTLLQYETGLLQDETRFSQNETTIPETPTETTQREKESAPEQLNAGLSFVPRKRFNPSPEIKDRARFVEFRTAMLTAFGYSETMLTEAVSDSIKEAATELSNHPANPDVSQVKACYDECMRRGWTGITPKTLLKVLPDILAQKPGSKTIQFVPVTDYTPPSAKDIVPGLKRRATPDDQVAS